MTPKGGLDETSMVIGELRSSVKNIEANQTTDRETQAKNNEAMFTLIRDIDGKLDTVNENLSKQKSKIAWISGSISAAVAYFIAYIKSGGSS